MDGLQREVSLDSRASATWKAMIPTRCRGARVGMGTGEFVSWTRRVHEQLRESSATCWSPRPRLLPEVPEKDPSPRNPNRLTASTWAEAQIREPAKTQNWTTAPQTVSWKSGCDCWRLKRVAPQTLFLVQKATARNVGSSLSLFPAPKTLFKY